MVIDTHAGAGMYQLDSDYATKSGESSDGVAKLWERKDLPPAIAEYVALIRNLNPAGKLRHYPGSPFIAERCMRSEDRLRLFELHSTDAKLLLENVRKLEAHAAANGIKHRGKRIIAERSDGFAALKALLPPPSRRALVLIDPPYENKDDYRKVKVALEDAQKRFMSGTYAVWYPVLSRSESQQLPERLKRGAQSDWLQVTLLVGAAVDADGRGLNASGMFILNPPWTLENTLRECLPWLTETLARDHTAQYTLASGSAAKVPKTPKPDE
jgi:23S rRNA (adenine2030-N6)-methyltransferase